MLVSEGGATWGPFLADRMDEAYRQHGAGVRPKLSKLPSAFLYEQVYASFQHDVSGRAANWAMGWKNVCWGSDYPHFEGTFGHTQKTLHELFDDVTRWSAVESVSAPSKSSSRASLRHPRTRACRGSGVGKTGRLRDQRSFRALFMDQTGTARLLAGGPVRLTEDSRISPIEENNEYRSPIVIGIALCPTIHP